MALRRFVRGTSTATGANANFAPNWSLSATESYADPNTTDPDSIDVSWGTDPEVATQDQDLTQTTGQKTHLGALIKFTAGAPDQFGGALVKLKPTYAVGETPLLEMWTYDGSTWTLRRRVQITNVSFLGTRTGEAKVFDLILSQSLTGVTKVWITMAPSAPTGTQANAFLGVHLYGACNEEVVIPDGNRRLPDPGYPNAGSSVPECQDMDPTLYSCSDPPGDGTPTTFAFPPFTLPLNTNDFLATNFSRRLYTCPQKKAFAFYFGNIPSGGSIRVTAHVVNYPGLKFNDAVGAGGSTVTTQTISADGVMIWWVEPGTGFGWPLQSRANDYLPPDCIIEFTFEPLGDMTIFNLLDVFLWYFAVLSDENEVC